MKLECKCTLSEKAVGDGCEVCNPSRALEYALETIAEQQCEIDRLREALRWYADEKNYEDTIASVFGGYISPVEHDMGDIATAALKETTDDNT